METGAGCLYVIATPIGNLDDLSRRAVDVLSRVETIAAEDTRHSAKLLRHADVPVTRLISLHDHNERRRVPDLLERLRRGAQVALVSDAGTPLVSDPGFLLVQGAWQSGITVVPIPGPSAITAALSVSPLPVNRFRFEGFLPSRAEARRKRLEVLATSPDAVVFFESPRRLPACLAELATLLEADRRVLVGRELTKQFETLYCAPPATLADAFRGEPVRGEVVCILEGRKDVSAGIETTERLLAVLLEELTPAQAARLAARATGRSKADVYARALRLGRDR